MVRTRLFHSVVIVGAGLLASCGKHASPPAAKPADAAPPADSAVDAAAPADAAVDAAAPVDAGAPHHAKPKQALKKPPDHVRIMIRRPDPPKPPQIMEGQ